MHKESFFQVMDDGCEIFVNRCFPDDMKNIKALVQISHGMLDYSERYFHLCEFLTEQGFVVNAHDHRGHGKTAIRAIEKKCGKLGFLAEKDGFLTVINDLHAITEKLKTDFPGKPVILFAHSWGSFIAQGFIELYGNTISKCILCGTAGPRRALINMGRILTVLPSFFHKKTDESPFFRKLSFSLYNSRIKEPFSKNAWVSRDNDVVYAYDTDPLCNFIPTWGFYRDLLEGLNFIHKPERIRQIPVKLPVFLIVGDGDPVGEWASTVKNLFKIYQKNGMENTELKIYPDARHELFNEINREQVFADILNWIQKKDSKNLFQICDKS